jgi:hypothetical protein
MAIHHFKKGLLPTRVRTGVNWAAAEVKSPLEA